MLKLSKKILVFLLALSMGVAMLVGCDEKKAVTSAPESTVSAPESITLTVAHWWGGSDPKAPVMENIWEKFQQDNINVKLEVEEIPSQSYNDKFTTWLAANTLPDVVLVESTHIEQLYEANSMLDLTKYFDSDKEWYNSFVPGIFNMGSTIDGKIFTMPNEYFSLPLFVNVDILKELSLSMPKTWDQLMSSMKAIKDDGSYLPLSMWGVGGDNTGVWFLSALGANGGSQKWIDATEGKGSFSDPAIIDGLNRMLEVCSYAQNGINGTEWTTSMANFNTRQSVFYLNGPWAFQQLADGDEGEAFLDSLELISIPYVDPAMEGYCLTSVVSYWALNSNLSDTKAESAVKLLKAITSKEATKEMMEVAQGLNGIRGVEVDQEKIGMLSDLFNLMDKMPKEGAAYPNPWPTFANPEITSEFQINLQKVVDKTITPKEFATIMDELVGNK